MALFKKNVGGLTQIKEIAFKKEKYLQEVTEKNLGIVFGLEFVDSEFDVQGLYIDTLAYDHENKSFVIVEYKRDRSFSVVDQGFSYLSLMLNNKADFILAYNEKKGKSLKRDDIEWSQARIIFIAPSFTAHQQNAVNFKNMPFELWEAAQFEGDLIQYKKLEVSKNAESIEKIKLFDSDTDGINKVTREIKTYSEEDIVGKSGDVFDIYQALKEQIAQIDPKLLSNPKAKYISYQMPNNWRNLFYINKLRKGLSLHFTRSTPKDFDDPKNRLRASDEKTREHKGQDMAVLNVENESDIRYAVLIIQQAYDRFVKEFGN